MHASSNCASPARRPATSGNHSLLQPHTRRSHPIISLPPPIHPCIHIPDLIKHVVVKVRHEIRSWENEKKVAEKAESVFTRKQGYLCIQPHSRPLHPLHSAPLMFCRVFSSFPLRADPLHSVLIVRTMQEGNRLVDQERLW